MAVTAISEAVTLSTPELIIGALKDVVLLGCAITGAIVAVKGLNTWKRQISGQSDYNLSKNLLISIYKYRDAINGVRSPFVEYPAPTDEDLKNMNHDEANFKGVSNVYEKRWEAVSEQSSNIYANLIEAEAIWDKKLSGMWKDVKKKEVQLFLHLRNFLTISNPKVKYYRKEHLNKKLDEIHQTIYDIGEEDKFKAEFEREIEKMTNYIRDKIKQ